MLFRSIFFAKPSGYDFQSEFSNAKLFWMMPALCVVTIGAGFAGMSQKVAGQLAGATPFLILAYGYHSAGKELTQMLMPTAWLALALGAALFIAARR